MFWKDGFFNNKKVVLVYDLSSSIIWKDDISFSRKYDLILWTENERWSFSKNNGNMIFSSNTPKRWYFQKKSPWNMVFLVLSGKIVFFPRKIWYFFFGRKMKDDLPKEIHGNMIFSVYMSKCHKYDITLLQKKNHRWLSLKKTHLKVIDILDRVWKEFQGFSVLLWRPS